MQEQTKETDNSSDVSDVKKEVKRILIVEDDDFLRGLLSDSLKDFGYKVDSAENAEVAFNFIDANTPNVVLLDLMLPGVGGLDILSEIKVKRKLDTSVVVLSNLGNKEDIDKALELGAVDFIVKAGVTPKQIIGRVEEVLNDDV
ncbi:MAG: response regulator transcription factor [Candidatus Pacebacteria bacterium]|nr:response regulator transcription factor [Candidatus Paceibacterota bacterium]